MLIIGLIYYTGELYDQGGNIQAIIPFEEFFSIQSLFVFTTFLAVPFKLKFTELLIITGSISFCFAVFLVYHLGVTRNKFHEIFPWVLFLITSSCAAIIMRIGRFHPYFEGQLPYYSPIAGLFQIGICLLVAVLICIVLIILV